WITLAGVVVVHAAAAFAGLQARRARQQVDHARDQAWSARDSAASAQTSAKAAVDQAGSAKECVELAKTQLYRADRPRLELSTGEHQDGTLIVVVHMT